MSKHANRTGKVVKKQVFNAWHEPLYRCPFPNCGSIFAKEPGKPDACIKHRNLIADVIYIINNLEKSEPIPEKPTGPKIYVPKPGMENQAIEEAKRASGGKR